MAKIKDPNKKHYFSEVLSEEFPPIFEKAIAEQTEVLLWEQGMSEKDAEVFLVGSYDAMLKKITLKSKTKGFLSQPTTSQLANKKVFVRIGSGKFQFFTTSTLVENNQKNYEFTIKEALYRTLQRQNYRLQAGPKVKIQIRFDDRTLKDCLDISAGGTAFVIKEFEAIRFKKDKVFKNCKLGLNKEKFFIPTVKVAGSWPIKDSEEMLTGEIKIGLSFEDVPIEIEEEMFKAINGEARAEEMRKKMLDFKKTKEKS